MTAIDQAFIENLSKRYDNIRDGANTWKLESEKVCDILKRIESDIKERYTIDLPINIGGTAIVVKVIDKNLGIPHALKFSRPVVGKEILFSEVIQSEISRLQESSHPNIVSIYFKGEVEDEGQNWPFYVMEYIENVQDAQQYIKNERPGYRMIVSLIGQCIKGLSYFHSQDTIHGDIKLENLLVSPDGQVKISDLGSARLINSDERTTVAIFTSHYAHPELLRLLSSESVSDSNRVRTEIPRNKLKKIFDLYAFGKNILRILEKYSTAEENLLPAYYRNYIELMACRMLDGYNSDNERALDLPKSAFKEIKYSSAEQVLVDVKKLTGEYSLCENIPELDYHFPRTLQISSSCPSSFTSRVARIVSSPPIRRLAGVSQLGLIVQIYPTATHSRLEHILGTFANVARYCDALWNDPINPFFKQIMTDRDINLVLISSLCHDIGQYALAHDLEEAESEIFSHTEIGKKILIDVNIEASYSLGNIIEEDWKVTPEEIVALLSSNPTDLEKPLKMRLLHALIDSPLDADKMDYLVRDSNNLNVPYGKCIDFDRLLKCLTVIFKEQAVKTFITLGIHEKGKVPAEALAFARYAMFGSVYWHHTSRSAKSMLHRAVWEALPTADKRTKEFKNFKEEFFSEILRQIGYSSAIAIQESFFENEKLAERIKTPQMEISDFRILSWLYERSSAEGRKLIEMICERRLFKRLLVVSAQKDSNLWKKLTILQKDYNWDDKLGFQNLLQKNLITIISNMESDIHGISSALSNDRKENILKREKDGEILFLVDIPGERKGSSISLYYRPESRTSRSYRTEEGGVQMEDSIIWMNLSQDFLRSVGKVRVFCHPDIAEICTALKRQEIEGALEAAYQSTS